MIWLDHNTRVTRVYERKLVYVSLQSRSPPYLLTLSLNLPLPLKSLILFYTFMLKYTNTHAHIRAFLLVTVFYGKISYFFLS